MNESYVLAEVSNENQTLVAVVQQDHRAAYFTFIPPKPTAIAIRCAPAGCATAAAPLQEDRAALEQGQPPMLAAEYCRNRKAKRR